MIRLLHLADIHPNNAATFAGKVVIDPETGLNQSLTDLRRSLHFVYTVATAAETRRDVAVIPGDLFDSPRPHANEMRIIVDFIIRLADEMPVLIIPGNHDLSQNPQDASALECLAGIHNVLIRERPDSVVLNVRGEIVWFSFLPYPSKGRLLAQTAHQGKSPEEVTALINHGLAAILRGFTLTEHRAALDHPHVLLAHGSVAGSLLVGEQPRSLAHDITIPLDELRPFDYVALGHIHQHQQVAPNAWYSGSLMRQSFGEQTEDKGFCLVDIEPKAARLAFVLNPHARVYKSLGAMDLPIEEGTLDPSIVWRFKDQLNPGDYQELKPILDTLQSNTPFLQVDVELLAEDRARDAGMASVPTMEDAIRRVLTPTVSDEDMADVLEKHALLVAEEVAS